MKVNLSGNRLTAEREGKETYRNESHFLHHVKLALIAQGADVIKKRMWKDGHMMGDTETQYIRSRNPSKTGAFMVYDQDWQIRSLHKDFAECGKVGLSVQRCNEES